MTVVSIGVNLTFEVVFTPLEYVPTIPPLSTYVINICFKRKEGPQHISSAFLTVQGRYLFSKYKLSQIAT